MVRWTGCLADCGLILAALGAGRLAIRHYRALPTCNSVSPESARGHVSIVVPARNEANRIGPLLASLRELTYDDVDVVVVDDESTDGTSTVARDAGVTVVRAGPLPQGWTGKSHACAVGASASAGEWILFTDADTVHAPDSLCKALASARDRRLDFLSLLARQRCLTWWEDLLLPFAYFAYFVGAVVGPSNPVLNGQYILCRRREYDRIGTHAAVCNSVIEDVALARHAAARGASIGLLRGEGLVSVRMYDSPRALWHGFAKNAARFVGLNPVGGLATGLAGLIFLAAPTRVMRSHSSVSGVALACAPAISLGIWRRELGLSPFPAVLYPIAALVFQLIALDSLRHMLRPGNARWKGRRL